MKAALTTLVGLGLLATGLPEAAGNPDCANLVSTSELRIVAGTEGSPASLEAPGFSYPGCDEPGDSLEITIDWGDGASSPARIEPDLADPRRYSVHGEHTYQRPERRLPIVIVKRNARTGVVSHDRHYAAEIAPRPFTLRATGRREGTLARATFAGRRSPRDLRATLDWGNGRRTRGVVRGSGRRLTVRATRRLRPRGSSVVVRVEDLLGRRTERVRVTLPGSA
jgi:hypothetical protein